MLIQELHDATRETLSHFFRTILKSPMSAKTLLHCLRVLRGTANNYRIQTERPSAIICYFCKTMHIIEFLCCTQIYTIICLKSVCRSTFADCRSQFPLDRLGRCLKLIVFYRGTSSHEFASQFGLEVFNTRKNSQTTVGPITDRPRHRPSERRNNLKGILYLHARWRLTSQFTQMVTDDFVGAPKPPQSKRKLSALQRSSQARQRMRRCGSSLTGNLHMRIT